MKLHISEMAELAGVSTRTLRYYDNIGLLKPTEIDETNGYRYYDEKSLDKLKRILYYREMEFPLKEIPFLITEENSSKRLTKRRRELLEKRKRIEEQIFALDKELGEPVKLTKSFDRVLKMYNFSGCAHIVNDEEYFCAWGKADYEKDIGFTPDTTFHVGGITMQFTAYCVLKFCERGIIGIDDFAEKYLPEFIHGKEITIKHLLDMTSGISDEAESKDYSEQFREYSEKIGFEALSENMKIVSRCKFDMELREKTDISALISHIDSVPLKFSTGTQFEYNCINYIFLGEILRRVSGKNLGEIFSEEIFKPFELRSTSFGGDCAVTVYAGDIPVPQSRPADGSYGIVSTTDDLLRWCRGLAEREIFKSNSAEFCCGFFKNEKGYCLSLDEWEMSVELSADFEKSEYSVTVRNRLPEPDEKKRVMYYPVHACDDGKIKFEVWQMQSGSAVRVTSLRIFDEKGEEVYSLKAPSGEYLIDVHNMGEVRHAADFMGDTGYFIELDLSEILGDDYSSEENYYAEIIADRGMPVDAQLGLVYLHDGEWCPMYCNVFYQREMSWALFMEALINSNMQL